MKMPKAKTISISIGLFLFFLFLSFPYKNIKGYIFGKIYEKSQIFLAAEDVGPIILGWPGIKLYKFSAVVPLDSGSELELAGDKLSARIGLAGLFPPMISKSVNISGMKKGGDIYFRQYDSKNSLGLQFDLYKLVIAQLFPTSVQDIVSGIVTGDGDFDFDWKTPTKSKGEAKLDVSELKMGSQNLQGFIIPAVSIGELKAKMSMKNGVLEFTQFQFGNDTSDLKGTITGDLRVGSNFMQSYLNLTLRLSVAQSLRNNPKATSILMFLDGTYKSTKSADYLMRWSGMLEEIATRSPFPQKVQD